MSIIAIEKELSTAKYANLREALCANVSETTRSFLGRLLDEGLYADRSALREELNNLVRNNYLYYNPTRAEYKLQGRSMEIGLHRYLQDMDSCTP